MKDQLARLVPVIERERQEAANRRQRRQVEVDLKASETELRALFAAISDVIAVFDQNGRYLKIAPTDPTYRHKPPDTFIGKTLHDVFPAEKADFFVEQIRQALAKGRAHRVEYSLELRGRTVWFDGSISPMSPTTVIWIARDISERKQAEEEKVRLNAQIESQNQRLTKIVANVPGVVWESWQEPDPGRQQVDFVSDYVSAMLGYTPAEWLADSDFWLRHVHPEDQDRMKQTAFEQITEGRNSQVEFRLRTRSGEFIWVETHTAPILDGDGGAVGTRGVTIDITERKRTEAALRESEERYRLMFEGNPHPMYVFDQNTWEFLAVNEAMIRHYGYRREEFLSMTITGIRPPQEISKLLDRLPSWPGGLYQASDWKHQKKNGEIIDVEITANQMNFAGKDAFVVLANDVTQRKRAEAALKQAEEKYRSIFENAVEGIFQATLEGRFLSVNPALARILGYDSPEDLLANRTDLGKQHYADPDLREHLLRQLHQTEMVVGLECEVLQKDGTRIWVSENIRAIRDEAGAIRFLEGSVEDITRRKLLEEQFRQAQKMEAIGQLAGGIAHDFNNLLTVITGYSELVLLRLPIDSPIRPKIEEIKRAGAHAASLTRQLLTFSRKQVLQPKPIRLNDLVTDMEKMLRRLIGEDILLETLLEPNLGILRADPGQIEQIIMNLVINARDAMPNGGKLVIETSQVQLTKEFVKNHVGTQPGPFVRLTISDNGVGMDASTQARIFEPFFTTKEVGKGTGLGLSTVYGIVQQSGGMIWVYSEAGLGTVFKIYFPLMETSASESHSSLLPDKPRPGNETILLAEDELMLRQLISEVLGASGYQVLLASNGRAALETFQSHPHPIHLFITDVVMPEMNGLEAAAKLKEIRPRTKILFISGYTSHNLMPDGNLPLGIDLLQKPFTPKALVAKVREVLESDR